jgi:hypothetical protein
MAKKKPEKILDMHSAEYVEYRKELKALGPVNTNEQAKKYCELWDKYHKQD